MPVKYWIAQHIEDLFRREPRNVGVIVQIEGQAEAKFLGELENLEIDGRKLKSFKNPEVYKQWIQYWRKTANKGSFEELETTSGKHYRIIEGGIVTETEGDSPSEITNNLFSTLVSEGGYSLAISNVENDSNLLSLENEIIAAFKDLQLLNGEVKNPVRRGEQIQGKTVSHKPSFIQQNGSLYIMETVDFTVSQKMRSRDHAGYTAYMFNDISQQKSETVPISIVKVKEEDNIIDEVANGLRILQNNSEVINWLLEDEKRAFLEQCSRIAYASY